ncbi:hypothetical protein GMORB2_0880 [Geosmithia morbida]|uniref:Uncharacterized protein n=1 Tax=Geosmithia morbida TaxID=1094350 RepID=A0A9P4Z1E0_9HYPO|nr:uncharacterized protein GMORB2_0880 [Geosmithia morbida]KAF4125636.1 hypothetical protein GMORB2_0880 [Geosmithia morbida]
MHAHVIGSKGVGCMTLSLVSMMAGTPIRHDGLDAVPTCLLFNSKITSRRSTTAARQAPPFCASAPGRIHCHCHP